MNPIMNGYLGSLGSTRITVSQHAVERVTNWPEKRRSRRLHKKLTKRLGPQFSEKPCAFKTPSGLVVHPDVYATLKGATS